ncbi:MAG: hypothetical protein FWC89_05635 [Defluviitaleaceae bacterium]|nr:hypothetical protein [Defluviitaleaceae bacterium]
MNTQGCAFIVLAAILVMSLAIFGACTGGSSSSGAAERIGSALAVNRATSNFSEELAERLSTTPLHAVGLLADSLQYGTVTMEINEYHNRRAWWNDGHGLDDDRLANYMWNFELHSDMQNRNFALHVNAAAVHDNESVDISMFLNERRLAFGSSSFDTYYGINFRTFRQDFRTLGEEMGLSASDLEMMESLLVQDMTFDASAYRRALTDFLLSAEHVTANVEIHTGRGRVNARRVEYTLTDAALSNLMREWLRTFEDDTFFARLDSLFASELGASHEEMSIELRNLVRSIERNMTGNMTIAFYIGANDRLLRVDISTMTINIYSEATSMDMVFDFGNSATDIWRLDISIYENWDTYSIGMIWESRQVGNNHVHDLDISVRDGSWWDTYTFTSNWNPITGDFVFTEEDVRRGSSTEELLRGNLIIDGANFHLSFEEERWNMTRSVEIFNAQGVNIPAINNFTNIGDLSIDELEDLIDNFVF